MEGCALFHGRGWSCCALLGGRGWSCCLELGWLVLNFRPSSIKSRSVLNVLALQLKSIQAVIVQGFAAGLRVSLYGIIATT